MEAEQIKVAHAPAPGAPHRYRQYLAPAFALSVALALVAGLYLRNGRPRVPVAAAPAPPPPVKIKTVEVQRGDIEQTVLASGKLQLFRYADLGAPISGEISDVFVAVGDGVKAGKLLIKIAPNVSVARLEGNQAQLAGLRAGLAEQQAQLDFAQLQFKRQTQLKTDHATSDESFESSRAAMTAATARVEAIKAHILETESATRDDDEARKHTEVTAPFSGTVVALTARPGQAVTAHQQAPALVRIADLSKLTVQARVAEIDVPHLHKGTSASFTTPGYPGKYWSGKVRQIVPVPADGSGEQGRDTFYNVLFEVGNANLRLMSGMSTQVSFVVAHAHDAIILPVAALGKPDSDGLYSLKILDASRHPQLRRVRIGIRNQHQAQVLAGLTPGEQVVIDMPAASASNTPVAASHRIAAVNPVTHLTPH